MRNDKPIPKSEIRNPKEARNPNAEIRRQAPGPLWPLVSDFGLRISFGFRLSDFGFVSSFVISFSGHYGVALEKALGEFRGIHRVNNPAVPRLAQALGYETKEGVQAIAR